jgi:hypothetical protein
MMALASAMARPDDGSCLSTMAIGCFSPRRPMAHASTLGCFSPRRPMAHASTLVSSILLLDLWLCGRSGFLHGLPCGRPVVDGWSMISRPPSSFWCCQSPRSLLCLVPRYLATPPSFHEGPACVNDNIRTGRILFSTAFLQCLFGSEGSDVDVSVVSP